MTVELVGLDFYAYHGVYEKEREEGNQFSVDVMLELHEFAVQNDDDLKQTVDYEEVYELVAKSMSGTVMLIETLANNIINDIVKRFKKIRFARVKVYKHNPPIKGKCKYTAATVTRKMNN